MILTLYPIQEPFIWSIRANWDVPNGMYYNTNNGAMYSVTDNPYVQYMGRIPSNYLKDKND
jgi:hypothetical protein